MTAPRSSSPANTVAERLATVRARIKAAALSADRDPSSVQLVAVAKTFDADTVRAAVDAGATIIGENYLQEALPKQDKLADRDIAWHYIGAIQSRKARAVAERFDFVHTVDRARIAQRLADARPAARGPLDVCIQVNLDSESTKAGVAPHGLSELAASVRALPTLRLRGLMGLPAPRSEPSEQLAVFSRLAALQDALRGTLPADEAARLDVLSMGMSADLEAAVAAGATHVRIGSALFGPRQRRQENAE
jgi:pyridoxal phosphate enzyme (YggS family)